jgi:methylenetetrahydrofolate dehydrogenase (NADP+)/methenyltetrahydrofolate cyclohydrolase
MTATVLDGRALAKGIREDCAGRVAAFAAAAGRPPVLATVLVTGDEASASYVGAQGRAASKLGFDFRLVEVPPGAGTEQARALVAALSAEPAVDAIVVAAPLPRPFDTYAVQSAIDPDKDADGATAYNQGLLLAGRPGPRPATAVAIRALVEATGRPLAGARATVIGRSLVVGKPAAILLLEAHATVTIAHSRTEELAAVARTADFLVCAAGVASLVRSEHVKPGAVVIDAGTNPVGSGENSRLMGDAAYDEVAEVAGWITPVPGGVGPVTNAMLLRGAVELAARRLGPT